MTDIFSFPKSITLFLSYNFLTHYFHLAHRLLLLTNRKYRQGDYGLPVQTDNIDQRLTGYPYRQITSARGSQATLQTTSARSSQATHTDR